MKVNKKAKPAAKKKAKKSAKNRPLGLIFTEANKRGLASHPIACLFGQKALREGATLIDRIKTAPKAEGKALGEVKLQYTPFTVHKGNVVRNTINGNTFPLSVLPADIRERVLKKAGIGKPKKADKAKAPKAKQKAKA